MFKFSKCGNIFRDLFATMAPISTMIPANVWSPNSLECPIPDLLRYTYISLLPLAMDRPTRTSPCAATLLFGAKNVKQEVPARKYIRKTVHCEVLSGSSNPVGVSSNRAWALNLNQLILWIDVVEQACSSTQIIFAALSGKLSRLRTPRIHRK